MREHEIPEKVRKLIRRLERVESNIDENFYDDEFLIYRDPFWFRELPWILKDVYEGMDGEPINIIPRRFLRNGECTDLLLVVVEPSFMAIQGDEYHPEMRIRKRIDASLYLIDKCPSIKYAIFWAAIWDFREWKKRESMFNIPVILKPWGQSEMILK